MFAGGKKAKIIKKVEKRQKKRMARESHGNPSLTGLMIL